VAWNKGSRRDAFFRFRQRIDPVFTEHRALPHGHPEKPKEYSRPPAAAPQFLLDADLSRGGSMQIAVIGAGLAGVAAAQALAADGHQVAVFERRASVAEETSFAPSGIAAAGLAAPWTPAAGWLRTPWSRADDTSRLRETGAAFVTPKAFGKAGTAEAGRRAAHALTLHRLLTAGVARIDALAQSLGLDFERGNGLLLTLPDAATAAQAQIAATWLQEAGETVEWADAARQRALEPGRAVADDAPRAVYLPSARIGNTREWTQLLRAHAQQLGVKFLFQHEVASVSPGPRPRVRFAAAGRDGQGATGTVQEAGFDAVIVCAAIESSRLLAPLGIQLPWRPIRGYSVTVPSHLREAAPDNGPRAALIDVRSGICISRLGTRVRVAGGHEPAAPAATQAAPPAKKALQPLYDALDGSFPGAVHWQQAQVWQGTRAALPDGLPAVGATGLPDVWLNLGHAHHGWALSQVAADALCTMIAGQPSRLDVSALAPQRLR
jgi:D-amino-acid dehydrogenase